MLWNYIELCGVTAMLLIHLAYRPLLSRHGHLIVGQYILRGPLLLGMVILPAMLALAGWPRLLPLKLFALASPLGVLLLSYALWLFWRSQHDLLLLPRSTIKRQYGVYLRIRHPLHAALWLAALAQFLLLQDWIGGMGGLVVLLHCYPRSVRREEARMLQSLGETYRQYMQQTGRLWPRNLAG